MNVENELPKGWVWTTLGEVCSKPQYGWTTKAERENGQTKLIRTTDISSGLINWDGVPYCTQTPENLDDYRIFPGDIVISRAGSIGLSYLFTSVPFEAVFASYLIRFRPSNRIDRKFIAYYLQTPSYWADIHEQSSGIALANINAHKLSSLLLPLAPLPEQQRIVEAIEQQFSCLEAGVALLRQAQKKLKLYRATVLKAAVEGELTAEWRAAHPGIEPASELLKRILAERRAKWEEEQLAKMCEKGIMPKDDKWNQAYKEPQGPDVSELPKLPDGWSWAALEQLVARSEYGTSVKCDYSMNGVPVLRIPNIAAGEIDLNDIKYSTYPLDINAHDALVPGDILVCRTNGSVNLIGKAALVKKPLNKLYTFASYLLRFRLVEAANLPCFVHLYLTSPQGRTFIEKNAASSAGQHNISLTLMHSLVLPLPPLAEQEQIVLLVEERMSIINELETTIEKALKQAERQRQSILHQAFTGKLVPQDPNDEPASVLLERIQQERQREKLNAQKVQPKMVRGKKAPRMAKAVQVPNGSVEPIDITKLTQGNLWQQEVDDAKNEHVFP